MPVLLLVSPYRTSVPTPGSTRRFHSESSTCQAEGPARARKGRGSSSTIAPAPTVGSESARLPLSSSKLPVAAAGVTVGLRPGDPDPGRGLSSDPSH
eukprot:1839914-Rhodomonas_salina.2